MNLVRKIEDGIGMDVEEPDLDEEPSEEAIDDYVENRGMDMEEPDLDEEPSEELQD